MIGYLTRATILALGLGGLVLLSRRIDFCENGKRCFYTLRKYFPRGEEKKDERSSAPTVSKESRQACPVCLGDPKNSLRAPCGHLICANCLARYCEVRGTSAPPCPLCRAPVKTVTLSTDIIDDSLVAAIVVDQNSSDCSTITEMTSKRFFEEVKNQCEETRGSIDRIENKDRTFFKYSQIFDDCVNWDTINPLGDDYSARYFITWSFALILLFSMKYQVLPWFEFFNGYETILNFLAVVPAIYIFWISYLNGLTMAKP